MINVADLIGIPYKPHGRDENGIDCFGLIWLIALRKGKPIPDVWYKGFSPDLISLSEQMAVQKVDKLQPGCIIALEREGRLHLGYAIDEERMIHATRNEGVIVENIVNYTIKGYYMLPEGSD